MLNSLGISASDRLKEKASPRKSVFKKSVIMLTHTGVISGYPKIPQ